MKAAHIYYLFLHERKRFFSLRSKCLFPAEVEYNFTNLYLIQNHIKKLKDDWIWKGCMSSAAIITRGQLIQKSTLSPCLDVIEVDKLSIHLIPVTWNWNNLILIKQHRFSILHSFKFIIVWLVTWHLVTNCSTGQIYSMANFQIQKLSIDHPKANFRVSKIIKFWITFFKPKTIYFFMNVVMLGGKLFLIATSNRFLMVHVFHIPPESETICISMRSTQSQSHFHHFPAPSALMNLCLIETNSASLSAIHAQKMFSLTHDWFCHLFTLCIECGKSLVWFEWFFASPWAFLNDFCIKLIFGFRNATHWLFFNDQSFSSLLRSIFDYLGLLHSVCAYYLSCLYTDLEQSCSSCARKCKPEWFH